MSSAKVVQQQLAQVTSARSETAVFVRMEDRLAVVNIGTSTIAVPCVGFSPPLPGMPVRIDWVNGSPSLTGPAVPLNPVGRITATGTPRATVTVDEVAYTLPVMSTYTPVMNDEVVIDWNIPIIAGKVAAVDVPSKPEENPTSNPVPFSVIVRAAFSGRYQSGSGWWGDDPWASSSNSGIWVYGNRVKDAVGSGTVTRTEIYLPLISELGLASIGVHPHYSIPGGAPSISSLNALSHRSGWVLVSSAVGPYLAAGGRGMGVVAPGGNGYTRWRGVASDSLSGALRITGTR